MDETTQGLLRRSRANPGDLQLLEQAIVGLQRTGQGVPADLLDRRVLPARTFRSEKKVFKVVAEQPDGLWTRELETPGEVAIPPHRVWWVTPQPVKLTGPVVTELLEQEVPGLTFGRSRQAKTLLPQLTELAHQLTFLSLESTGTTDEALAELPQLDRLTELTLSGCKMSHEGLGRLSRTPNLLRLFLDNVKKVKDLSALSQLAHLRRVSLSRAGVTLKLIKTLPTLPALTHLNLYGNPLSPKMVQQLPDRVPGLRELVIGPKEHAFDQDFLESLSGFSNLSALTIPGVWGESVDLRPLSGLTQLRYLDLHATRITDPAALGELAGLTKLVLRSPTDLALEAALSLRNLRHLLVDLSPSRVGWLARAAAAFPKLEVLELPDLGPVGGDPETISSREATLAEALRSLSAASALRLVRLEYTHHRPGRIDPPAGVELAGVELRQERIRTPPAEPPTDRFAGPWALY